MNNFLTKAREYYDTLFPLITDENIVRRTFVFYTLFYLSLFFTGFAIGAVSISNLALTIVLYLFFCLTASNFILSHKAPNPKYIFSQFSGFNLFICAFILYFGFIFLLGSFIFAFNINLSEFRYANIITLILLSILFIFLFGILFHYIKNGSKGIYRFVSAKAKKNVTSKK